MFPANEFEARFRELLAQLDALAEESGDEDLEELNAEFEDALFMMSGIDMKAGDWGEEMRDALEELDALCADYQSYPGAQDVARRFDMLIRMAENNLEAM